jgi:iron-sulfur cluster assembly protein
MSDLITATSASATTKLVNLTPSARVEVRRLLSEQPEGTGLRLGIKGGGCSGLTYVLDFTPIRDGDTTIPYDGFEVYLDRKSTIYLGGVELDHQAGLTGKGFVFRNPHATNTCGCGESFSL